jgi:16S rRNA (cytidine1402-2'-O)-methyltransferase
VLVVSPPAAPVDAAAEHAERVLRALLAELPLSKAVQLAAAITGERRNALYDLALTLARDAAT